MPKRSEGFGFCGNTMFDAIASFDHDGLKVIIDSGVSADVKNDDFCPAIVKAAYENNFEAVKILCESGCNINAKSRYGETALMFSIRYADGEIFDYLLERNVELDVCSVYDGTALMVAILYGNNLKIEKLVNAGAWLEVEDNNGFTALTYAFYHPGCTDQIRLLVELGANLHHRGQNAYHMLGIARQEENYETIEWFYSFMENRQLTANLETIDNETAVLQF